MIVSCPSCSAKYRIRDDKIQGRGARITCPKCSHRFVVYKDEPAEPAGIGVPVTFQRDGQNVRGEFEEDDEADVPTTVMPHGSQLQHSIRAAAASPGMGFPTSATGEKLEARVHTTRANSGHAAETPSAGELRDAAKKDEQGGGNTRAIVLAVALVLVVAVAGVMGLLPIPGL